MIENYGSFSSISTNTSREDKAIHLAPTAKRNIQIFVDNEWEKKCEEQGTRTLERFEYEYLMHEKGYYLNLVLYQLIV